MLIGTIDADRVFFVQQSLAVDSGQFGCNLCRYQNFNNYIAVFGVLCLDLTVCNILVVTDYGNSLAVSFDQLSNLIHKAKTTVDQGFACSILVHNTDSYFTCCACDLVFDQLVCFFCCHFACRIVICGAVCPDRTFGSARYAGVKSDNRNTCVHSLLDTVKCCVCIKCCKADCCGLCVNSVV